MRLEGGSGQIAKGPGCHAEEFEIYSKSRGENCHLFHRGDLYPYHTEKEHYYMIQFSTFHLKQKDK